MLTAIKPLQGVCRNFDSYLPHLDDSAIKLFYWKKNKNHLVLPRQFNWVKHLKSVIQFQIRTAILLFLCLGSVLGSSPSLDVRQFSNLFPHEENNYLVLPKWCNGSTLKSGYLVLDTDSNYSKFHCQGKVRVQIPTSA